MAAINEIVRELRQDVHTYPELNQLAKEMLRIAEDHGFTVKPEDAGIDRALLLIISEICEGNEELRDGRGVNEIYYREIDGKPEGFPIEIADALIRLTNLCAALNIDIARAVGIKAAFNETRPYKHGRKF